MNLPKRPVRPFFAAILAVALLAAFPVPSMAAAQVPDLKELLELAKDPAAGDCDEQEKIIVAYTGGDWCIACKRWKAEELEKVLDKGYSVRFVRDTESGREVPRFELPRGYTLNYFKAELLPNMLTGEPGSPPVPETKSPVSAETLCPIGSKSCPIPKPSTSSSSASSSRSAAGNLVASSCPCPPGCNCPIDCDCRNQPSVLSNPNCVDCPRAVAVHAQLGRAARSVQTYRERGRFFWGRRR